tara:strand:+ start:406 stop:1629 length:1224 start_codon:yes stop_codon:yes gene_type:complete
MSLGLGNNLSSTGMVTPGIVTDNLVLKHNYSAGSVIPVSDGAAYFDGDDDNILIGSDSSVDNIFDGGGTISGWIYAISDGQGNFGRILDKASAGNGVDGWSLTVEDHSSNAVDLNFMVGHSTTYGRWTTTAREVPTHTWTHFALTYNDDSTSNEPIIYVNGAIVALTKIGSGPAGTKSDDASQNLYIGASTLADRSFEGYISNTGMWSSVLTQAQIKSIMNKNYAGLTDSEKTNLVSWWNLDSAYDIDDTTESTETTQYVFDNHHGGGDTLGGDVMTGGDMSSDSGWTLNSGWSISDGKLRRDTTDSYNTAYRATSGLTEGKLYKVTVDVSTTNGNPLLIYLGEAHSGSVTDNVKGRTQVDGTVIYYLVAGANENVYFYSGSGGTRWTGTIDNVVIQEVNGNYGVLK